MKGCLQGADRIERKDSSERQAEFKCFYPEWRKIELEWLEIEPHAWVRRWAALCLLKKGGIESNRVHKKLIDKAGRLSGKDFEKIGKWKERCLAESNGRWKSETPAAYDTWMLVKAELPKCPTKGRVANFLKKWSEKKFAAGVSKKTGHVRLPCCTSSVAANTRFSMQMFERL